MESFLETTLVLIIAAVLLGLPMWVLVVLRRKLQAKHPRIATVVKAVLWGWSLLGFSILFCIVFPPDSYFENEFERITNRSFPASGHIVRGAESGFDPHGDYTVCVRLTVDDDEYKRLLREFRHDTDFCAVLLATDTSFVGSDQFRAIGGQLESQLLHTFSCGVVNQTAYRFVGFLTDQHTIIVYRCSS